jgi:hypothetical protein
MVPGGGELGRAGSWRDQVAGEGRAPTPSPRGEMLHSLHR